MFCDEYMIQYYVSLNNHAMIKWSCSEIKKKEKSSLKEKEITEI